MNRWSQVKVLDTTGWAHAARRRNRRVEACAAAFAAPVMFFPGQLGGSDFTTLRIAVAVRGALVSLCDGSQTRA